MIQNPAPSRRATVPTLTAVSGVGSKGPACFLLEAEGRRLMLDLGYGPMAGLLPNVAGIGRVDALLISHGHRDHVGGAALLSEIGDPPVFATEMVTPRLPDPPRVRTLPLAGEIGILGLRVTTGRDGHAPGGVWLHVAVGDGFLYMGDYSTESLLYAADPPPRAATAVIDASAGTNDTPLADRIAALDAIVAAGPVLLPVPPDGRGPEIALHLARSGRTDIRLDDAMREAIGRFVASGTASLHHGVAGELTAVLDHAGPIDGPHGVMLAASADGMRGESARLIAMWEAAPAPAIVFTGYLTPGTPAERLVAGGRAQAVVWNVHPRLSDNVALVRAIGARTVVPAFCDADRLPALAAALAPARVTMDRKVTL